MKYEPPYSLKEIKEKYSNEIYQKLKNDPVHKWRAESGIELIHKEPDFDEQIRIWKNWNLMSDEQKKISENKSFELFGISNEEHHKQIMDEFYPNRKFDVIYENIMTKIGSYQILAAPSYYFENPKTFKNIPIDKSLIFELFQKSLKINLILENSNEELQIGNSALGYLKSKINDFITKIDFDIFEMKLSKNWIYYEEFFNKEKQDLYFLKFDFKNPEKGINLILNFLGDRFSNNELLGLKNDIKNSLNTSGLCINFYFAILILLDSNTLNNETILHEFYHYVQMLLNLENKFDIFLISYNELKNTFGLDESKFHYLHNKFEFWDYIFNNLYKCLQKIYWLKFKSKSWNEFIDTNFYDDISNNFEKSKINDYWITIINHNYFIMQIIYIIAFHDKVFFKKICQKIKDNE